MFLLIVFIAFIIRGIVNIFANRYKIAQTYFGGHIAYKQRGGVDYDEPKFQNDTIIVTYKNYTDIGKMINQGEFRFKWDEKAQWFSVEQVKY